MCTVSWLYTDSGYELMFNRDELRSRGEAIPPSVAREAGINYLSPTDSDRGGTWIGVNEFGITHCLLNYYEAMASAPNPPAGGFRSRGELVRLLQWSDEIEKSVSHLSELELSLYPPFLILAISADHRSFIFRWNGASAQTTRRAAPPVTTSSFEPENVSAWRSEQFRRKVVGRAGSVRCARDARRRLWRFHRLRSRRNSAYGVCMSRSDARTLSCTSISVSRPRTGNAEIAVRYVAKPPCESDRLPEPVYLRQAGAVSARVFDSKRMFAERAPNLARRLPPGTFPLLRAVLHEKRVNRLLCLFGHLDALRFCERILNHLEIEVHAEGLEHLRNAERPVIVSNHPTGALEGIALIAVVLRERGQLAVPANEVLTLVPALSELIVPIDRYRGNAQVARKIHEVFEGNSPVLFFPAGRTARMRSGRLREFPWSKSFVTHARRADREIVPVCASGQNSRLFYAIHRVRTALDISLNIEMMLLIDELIRHRGENVCLHFGRGCFPGRSESGGNDSGAYRARDSSGVLLRDQEVARGLQRRVEWGYDRG